MVRNVSTEVLQILYCTELHGDAIIGCSWIGIHLSNPEMLLLIFPGPEIAEPAIPPKEEAANISQGKRMWGPVLFFHVQYDWVHSSSATIKITYSLHSFWMERHELYIHILCFTPWWCQPWEAMTWFSDSYWFTSSHVELWRASQSRYLRQRHKIHSEMVVGYHQNLSQITDLLSNYFL